MLNLFFYNTSRDTTDRVGRWLYIVLEVIRGTTKRHSIVVIIITTYQPRDTNRVGRC